SGPIPAELSQLDSLKHLDLTSNPSLSGSIPAELGLISNLETLVIGNNAEITGPIPATLGNLSKLKELSLYRLSISGNIPPELGNLSQLKILNINFSLTITGKIPQELWQLSNLEMLTLIGLGISDTISTELGNLTKLKDLYLSSNPGLTGSIPAEIENLNDLQSLFLGSTKLSGSLPIELSTLLKLKQINIGNSNFSGSVPQEIANLPLLETVFISSNNFENIPDFSLGLANLKSLFVDNNKLGFDDILPNIGSVSVSYYYSPQKQVPTVFNQLDSVLSVQVGGENNIYSWFRNGISLNQFTDTLKVSGFTNQVAGFYYCQISNPNVPGLTIQSEEFRLGGLSVPQGLLGFAGDHSIVLNWQANPALELDFSHYLIYWGADSNTVDILDSIDSRLTLIKDVLNLESNTGYYFRIQAVDTNGNQSARSPFILITTFVDQTAPTIPQGLTANAGNQSVLLRWLANPFDEGGLAKYVIYWGNAANPTTILDSTLARTDTTYLIGGLDNDQTYYFRLKAVDGDGNMSDYSNEVSATPHFVEGMPSTPQNLTAVGGDHSIRVTWSANPEDETDFSYYVLYYRLNQTSEAPIDTFNNRLDTVRLFDGFVNNVTYYFRVRAFNINDIGSDYSDEASASGIDIVPSIPQGLQATAGNTFVTLNWTANPDSEIDIKRYVIYGGTTTNPETAIDSVDNRLNTTHQINGLQNGQRYYFRLKAVDYDGFRSDYSDEVSIIPYATLQLSAYVGQNPVVNDYLTLWIEGNVAIDEVDVATMTVEGSSTDLYYSASNAENKLYSSSYKLTGSGQYDLHVHAMASNGSSQTIDKLYEVSQLSPAQTSVLAMNEGQSLLTVQTGSVSSKQYLIGTVVETSTEVIYQYQSGGNFEQALKLTLAIDRNVSDPGKYFIYRQNGNDWEKLATQVYDREGKLEAVIYTRDLGSFKLAYNASFSGTNLVPNDYALKQNYPNPFNPSTTIQYDLANDGHVRILIYNVLGQRIRELINENQLAGSNKTLVWDGRDQSGKSVASGVYIYQIISSGFSASKRMLLIK
ncbi:MAG: fibronectin type III domain-containing protein, partial [Calditrichaeota bacterium]|nr:fibronectin type III domain-containing protein [Calditrichota bacterium]